MSNRVVIGHLADGNFGVRVSKAGFNANANPPVAANLIFDSQWPQTVPILQSGVFAVYRNQSASVSFPTLPFVPLFSLATRSPDGSGFGTTWVVNRGFNTQYYKPPNNGTPVFYLQIWTTANSINAYMSDPSSSSQYDPNPTAVAIGYSIYNVAI